MKQLSINKTFDLRFKGAPSQTVSESETSLVVAVSPSSIPFIKPKLTKKIGESVQSGEVLYFDKSNDAIQFVSPVSGTIKDIQYGERRALDAVIIEKNDAEPKVADTIDSKILSSLSEEELKHRLLNQGLWPFLRSFPFRKVADPLATIPAIYVTLDDQEPFKPSSALYSEGKASEFSFGLEILNKLSSKVEVVSSQSVDYSSHPLKEFVTISVKGHYPATDPGVVLYKNKTSQTDNSSVYISGQDLIRMAQGLQTGLYPSKKLVVVSGSLVQEPFHCWVNEGDPLTSIVKGLDINAGEPYTILGGLFTGRRSNIDSYLGFYDDAIQLIASHNGGEFFNFFKLGGAKTGYSKSYLGGFFKSLFSPSAGLNGGDRDCIACSYCADVCPVDLLPQYVFKYVQSGDVETAMQNGLLDCTECGVCTYVCPSKINLDHQFKVAKAQLHKEAMG